MPAGFLYVLINPSMLGLAKVGKTTRDPSNRVAELSSATGVPSPFMLAFQQPVAECDSAEIWVHRELERKGYRHADNREFFNAPLHEIIQIVVQASSLTPVPAGQALEEESEHDMASPEHLAEELYDLAKQHQDGSDYVLKNDKKALELLEQAAALGHRFACVSAGQYYQFGSDAGIPKDAEKALIYYRKAVELGDWTSESFIAELFLQCGQEMAAKTHWNLFFERACKEIERVPDEFREICAFDIGFYGRRYCEAVAMGEIAACVPDRVISNLAKILVRFINSRISKVAEHPNKQFANDMTKRLQAARRYVNGTIT